MFQTWTEAMRSKFRLGLLGSLSRLRATAAPAQKTTSLPSTPRPREEPDDYGVGGFHRVRLQDQLHSGRYTILRKLGYGQYSTVWLARDTQEQKYACIKILQANCYDGTYDIFEKEILSKIAQVTKKSTHEGRLHICQVRDQFEHVGPNGTHVCLAFDVLGHHLNHQVVRFKDKRLPFQAVKSITRQLLQALDFLHKECGVIHTDLQPRNFLIELENPQTVIEKYLSETLPRLDDSSAETPVPLYEVIKTPIMTASKHPHIRLIDFGVSSWIDKRLSDRIQPPSLRAPEAWIRASWGPPVDIWSLGCLILEFTHGYVLFQAAVPREREWKVDENLVAKMIKLFGSFPPAMLEEGQYTKTCFDENGALTRFPDLRPENFRDYIDGSENLRIRPEGVSNAEIREFEDFLRGMLVIDPSKRRTAAQLLQHDWLKS